MRTLGRIHKSFSFNGPKMTSSDDAFELGAARLAETWRQISELQLALNCSLTGPLKANPHARRMQSVLEDMGSLIDEGIEVADDHYIATRKTICALKEQAPSPHEPANVVCFSCKEKKSAVVSGRKPVHQDDAACVEQGVAAHGNGAHAEWASGTIRTWDPKEMFDLMARKPPEKRATRTVTATSPRPSPRKRSGSFSASDCEPRDGKTKKKKKMMKIKLDPASPDGSRQPSKPSDPSLPRPLGICECRGVTIQREYAFLYEGIPEPIWKAPRHATEEEMRLISTFKAQARRFKLQENKHEGRTRATRQKQPGELYSVEKIVDHRTNKHGRKQYLVKWDSYDSSENTWEAAAKLRAEVPRVVEEYERGIAMEASRMAKVGTRTKKVSKAKPTLQQTAGAASPAAISEAIELAKSATLEPIPSALGEEDEEPEDSIIERMAISDRSGSDSDSDSDNGASE